MRIAVVDNEDRVVVSWDSPHLARAVLSKSIIRSHQGVSRLIGPTWGRLPKAESVRRLELAIEGALLDLQEETRTAR